MDSTTINGGDTITQISNGQGKSSTTNAGDTHIREVYMNTGVWSLALLIICIIIIVLVTCRKKSYKEEKEHKAEEAESISHDTEPLEIPEALTNNFSNGSPELNNWVVLAPEEIETIPNTFCSLTPDALDRTKRRLRPTRKSFIPSFEKKCLLPPINFKSLLTQTSKKPILPPSPITMAPPPPCKRATPSTNYINVKDGYIQMALPVRLNISDSGYVEATSPNIKVKTFHDDSVCSSETDVTYMNESSFMSS